MGLLARMEVVRHCDADVSEAVDKKFVADYFFLLQKSACSGATVIIDRLQRTAADHPMGVRIYNHIPARANSLFPFSCRARKNSQSMAVQMH
jgi:hypothetical protein